MLRISFSSMPRKELISSWEVTLPTLIIHGDKDASAQIDFTGRRTAKLMKGSQFKVYPGAPHGLIITHAEQFNNDLAQFVAM